VLLWVAFVFIILVALLSALQHYFERKWKVAR
jgi:ABC-type amino acid transport system permease subunit